MTRQSGSQATTGESSSSPIVESGDHPHAENGHGVRRARPIVGGLGIVAVVLAAYLLSQSGQTAASLSLLIGGSLGILFQRGRFCFYCILRDFIEDRNGAPLYSLLAALAVGAVGYAFVFGMFLPDPTTGRLPPQAHIGPVSWVLVAGGVAFGVGMALSGACISGHLYRLGEGYFRAVPALLGSLVGFGVGFVTWNSLYIGTIASAPTLWLPATFGYGGALLLFLGLIAVLAWYLLRYVPESAGSSPGRLDATRIRKLLLGKRWNGLVTGALVGVVGVFAYLRIEPLGVTSQLSSITRTVLDGTDLLPDRLYGLDVLRGCVAVVVDTITNNGWLIIGLVAASAASAFASDRFRPVWPGVVGSSTALAGGILMGWGSMVALGCTVGVLLSGSSALAVSGLVFGVAVFAGVYLGIKLRFHRWNSS